MIIGASSGIGKELTKIFASHGFEVGIAARRIDLLNKLGAEIPTKIYTATIDIKNTDIAIQSLEKLIKDVGDVDIIV
ncbi:MAG: SDR family NAD(P)-dependent oxidoreductase, partial [Deltaproteobacteria bacterium]|nr:SDR family NAD(P)-dependent oxidoreductase [Deltaproteobacteria bacterium]